VFQIPLIFGLYPEQSTLLLRLTDAIILGDVADVTIIPFLPTARSAVGLGITLSHFYSYYHDSRLTYP
jgi:hypothetical protein